MSARNYPPGAARTITTTAFDGNSVQLRAPQAIAAIASGDLLLGGSDRSSTDANATTVRRLERARGRVTVEFDANAHRIVGGYRVNCSTITANDGRTAQCELQFDARGRHTRTWYDAARNGTALLRNISYGEASQVKSAADCMLRVMDAQVDLHVCRQPADSSNAWSVRTQQEVELLRVESAARADDAGIVQKVIKRALVFSLFFT